MWNASSLDAAQIRPDRAHDHDRDCRQPAHRELRRQHAQRRDAEGDAGGGEEDGPAAVRGWTYFTTETQRAQRGWGSVRAVVTVFDSSHGGAERLIFVFEPVKPQIHAIKI